MPFGLGAWAPIVPGREYERLWWRLWGAVWAGVSLGGWVLASTPAEDHSLAGTVILIGWAGGVATAMDIFIRQLPRMPDLDRLSQDAKRRLAERRKAQQLAVKRPEIALELGIGRPDLRGAEDAGLVDVNNAPLAAILLLPGVDEPLAVRIVEIREEIDGFTSLGDFGHVLDLDGRAVERLRDRAVFLPR